MRYRERQSVERSPRVFCGRLGCMWVFVCVCEYVYQRTNISHPVRQSLRTAETPIDAAPPFRRQRRGRSMQFVHCIENGWPKWMMVWHSVATPCIVWIRCEQVNYGLCRLTYWMRAYRLACVWYLEACVCMCMAWLTHPIIEQRSGAPLSVSLAMTYILCSRYSL